MSVDDSLESKTNQRRGGKGRPRQSDNARIISILSQLKHINLCSSDKNKTFNPGHIKADLGSNFHTLPRDLDLLFQTKNIIQVCHFRRGKIYGKKTYYYLSDKGKETLAYKRESGV